MIQSVKNPQITNLKDLKPKTKNATTRARASSAYSKGSKSHKKELQPEDRIAYHLATGNSRKSNSSDDKTGIKKKLSPENN
jgi:hypothetical protein